MKTRNVQNPERDVPLSEFYRSEQNCVIRSSFSGSAGDQIFLGQMSEV